MRSCTLVIAAISVLLGVPTDSSLAAPVPSTWKVKLVAKFPSGHRQGVSRLAFSPDGKMLASADFDHTVKLWDIAKRKNTATLGTAVGSDFIDPSLLSFSPDSKTLATAIYSQDPLIHIWDVASGKKITTLKTGSRWVTAFQFSADGRTLAAGVLHEVQLWEVPSYKKRATFKLKLDLGYALISLVFTHDGKLLVLGGGNKYLVVFDVASDKKRGLFLESSNGACRGCYFSPDGKYVAASSSLYSVRLWDAASGKNIADYEKPYEIGPPVYSPNGKVIALNEIVIRGRGKSPIRLLNARTATELATITTDNADPGALAFSHDGVLLAGADEGHIYLWDVRAFSDPSK